MPRFRRAFPRTIRRLVLSLAFGLVSALPAEWIPSAAAVSLFYPTIGWKDDVDLVVAPGGQFVVLCEEDETRANPPRFEIFDLDPVTGSPIAPRYLEIAPGFENGVDPIIVSQAIDPLNDYAVLVPCESEDGSMSSLIVLRVDGSGAVLERHAYDLGNLGYAPDVDGIATVYPDLLIAFFPLASEDNTVRGVLAVDIDVRDNPPAGNAFGTATLLSTDGRLAATENLEVDWLPGLADAMDPVAFNSGESARLALPVSSAVGSDLLLIDFDPGCAILCEPPLFMGYASAKERNETGVHPLAFPGYERDVDITLFNAVECGLDASGYHLLVPVEGAGDVGDLYMLDQSGFYEWAYSVVSTGAPIPGYEAGVDLLRLCDLGAIAHPHRLAVPVENAAGTDANLLFVDAATGELVLHVEMPSINPDLVVPGWEIGVEPLQWTSTFLLAPVEGGGVAGLFVFDATTGSRLSGSTAATSYGFVRSVDPIVAPLPDVDRTLFVPMGRDDASETELLMFPAPPDVEAPISLETLNGISLTPYEWDVDPGLVKKTDQGGAYLYLPEENLTGTSARLRFETVPTVETGRVLAVTTQAPNAATPGALRLFRTADGSQIVGLADVLGLETGLDMASGGGPLIAANPPARGLVPGYDADTDPTLVWVLDAVGVEAPPPAPSLRLSHGNPIVLPARIRIGLGAAAPVRVTIVNLAGRRVRMLVDRALEAGEHVVPWDGRDDRGARVAPGAYFIEVRGGTGRASSRMIVVE